MYEREIKKPSLFKNVFLYYNDDINLVDRQTYTLSYDEFVIRRILKFSIDLLTRLLCMRNAHYKKLRQ